MPSPAQIANDMSAHADFWAMRDAAIARTCLDAARVIRALVEGGHVDGRTYGGLHRRLLGQARYSDHPVRGYPNFDRARLCLERLWAEARNA